MMMKKGQSCSIIKQHFVMMVVLICMLLCSSCADAGTAWTDVTDGTTGADGDTLMIYDLSETANREITLANFWTGYLADKLSAGLVAGSVTTPSIGFTADTNTGIYWVSADTIGFTTGGTGRYGMSSTGFFPYADGTYTLGQDATRFSIGYFDDLRVDEPDSDDDVGDRAYNDARYGGAVETKAFSDESTYTFTISDSSKLYRLTYTLAWASGSATDDGGIALRSNSETDDTYNQTMFRTTGTIDSHDYDELVYMRLGTSQTWARSMTGVVAISTLPGNNKVLLVQGQVTNLYPSSDIPVITVLSGIKTNAAELATLTLFSVNTTTMAGMTGTATLEVLP